jgi:hypothetical protein
MMAASEIAANASVGAVFVRNDAGDGCTSSRIASFKVLPVTFATGRVLTRPPRSTIARTHCFQSYTTREVFVRTMRSALDLELARRWLSEASYCPSLSSAEVKVEAFSIARRIHGRWVTIAPLQKMPRAALPRRTSRPAKRCA